MSAEQPPQLRRVNANTMTLQNPADMAREMERTKMGDKDFYINYASSNPTTISSLPRYNNSQGDSGVKKIHVSPYLTRDELDADSGLIVSYDSDGTRLINGCKLLTVGGNEYYYDVSKDEQQGGVIGYRKSKKHGKSKKHRKSKRYGKTKKY